MARDSLETILGLKMGSYDVAVIGAGLLVPHSPST